MLTICWAAKGGSGTSVTATALALATDQPTLLVDLAGELPWVLGVGDPDVPGILDWLDSDSPVERVDALEIPLSPGHNMIHRGQLGSTPVERWRMVAHHWRDEGRHVIVDAGTNPPTAVVDVNGARRLLVTRQCYLSVRAAVAASPGVDGIIVIEEPGRALRSDDLELALGAPVVAHLLADPAVSRAVDAGLLTTRLPRAMRKQLRPLAA